MNRPFEIDGEYFIFLNESPDLVTVGDGDNHKTLFQWNSGGMAFPFGYYNGKMVIGQEGGKHSETIGRKRDSLKYPGRIWTKKKVISFWVYPPLSELKKVLKDLQDTFNNVPLDNYGSYDFPDDPDYYYNRKLPKSRGEDYGKLSINGSWKLDIPENNGSTYNEFAKKNSTTAISQGAYYAKGYLYSLKTVFSNKPLKGVGKMLRKGEEVSTQGVDHVAPAMLKKGAIAKLGKKEKESLYNYFKDKGRLSKAEERMYKMIRREDIDIFFDGKKFIFEEKSNKKHFTLEEGSGILREM